MKNYQCAQCGRVKSLFINHDGLPWVWEKCTDECSWSGQGERGPRIMGSKTVCAVDSRGFMTSELIEVSELTHYCKRKYVRVEQDSKESP